MIEAAKKKAVLGKDPQERNEAMEVLAAKVAAAEMAHGGDADKAVLAREVGLRNYGAEQQITAIQSSPNYLRVMEDMKLKAIEHLVEAMPVIAALAKDPDSSKNVPAFKTFVDLISKTAALTSITINVDNRSINLPMRAEEWGLNSEGQPYHKPSYDLGGAKSGSMDPSCVRHGCKMARVSDSMREVLYDRTKDEEN